jgi:thiol-disulfide isomerase/thioredoxin
MKNILPWYALLLIVLLCSAIMMREGFESSPSTLFTDIANKKVLLLVYSTNCGHCKKLKPVWDKVASKNPEKMVAIDATNSADESISELTSKLNIDGYPTIIVMNNGQPGQRYDGDRSEQALSNFVKSM